MRLRNDQVLDDEAVGPGHVPRTRSAEFKRAVHSPRRFRRGSAKGRWLR